MVEDRLVGIKSREIYEAPGAVALIEAHQALESVTLERLQRRYKRQLEQTWGELVYEAQWYSPLKKSMDAFIEHTQQYVSGDIRMVLHGGRATVNGRRSESSLYDFNLATYETGDTFDQSSSRGFIDIYGLQSKLAAARDVRLGVNMGYSERLVEGVLTENVSVGFQRGGSGEKAAPASLTVSCMTYEASAVSDAVGSGRDDALRTRMMRYTVAAMFFVGFAGKGVRGIFGDIGSLVPMLILLVSFVVLFRTSGRSLLMRRFPTTTCLFVAWCALSCLWSVAPAQSAQFAVLSLALTLVSIAVAVALPLTELVGALILAFQWIIGSSFILEALVAFFVRGPLAPPIMWGRGLLPASSYYWVDGLLLEGGPIQGFPGNRNPLAFIALLLAVCLQFFDTCRRGTLGSRRLYGSACAAPCCY